jgi:hydroxyacylglutathione hydrolase
MIEVVTLEVTPFMQNARILFETGEDRAVVVDPGGESDRIIAELTKRKLRCQEIWLTHSHLDHCGGVRRLKEVTKAPLLGHPVESMMRARVVDIAAMYGLPGADLENCPEPERMITGGETLTVGSASFEVLFTPGHSPGHLCFYNRSNRLLIAGDTLFQGSIGRTDLPGGDFDVLMDTIKGILFALPPDTRVMSGHGPDTTIGEEQQTNPFVRG